MEQQDWPHQSFGVAEVIRHAAAGETRICLTSPTGGGKSRMIERLAQWGLANGRGVCIYVNRKLLMDQLIRGFRETGMDFGARAADHFRERHKPLQLCSLQTEHSRVVKRDVWAMHDAGLVIVDEAHVNDNPSANAVIDGHLRDGATVVGLTATPLGLSGRYDVLVQAGRMSELRACGACIPATHFGCDEPDLSKIKNYRVGDDLTEKQNVKAMMVPGVHGRVIDWFKTLNPHALPSIGFAPGVTESIGFAEAFEKAGIPAAHIDGKEIWFRGSRCQSTEERREQLKKDSQSGKVRIVWNRFVLREGINMPWLAHGVLACVFGSVQTYLQACGRLLRAHPGVPSVTIQDHGGNWWRHGSVNADREWNLDFTSNIVAGLREDAFAGGGGEGEPPPPPEPFLCVQCKGVVVLAAVRRGPLAVCPHCGFTMDFTRRGRTVIQFDGTLHEHPGGPFKRKRVDHRPDTEALWVKYYWRAKNSEMTFKQAVGLFAHEQHYWPPKHLPLMPKEPLDWFIPVKSVPFNRLRPKEEK